MVHEPAFHCCRDAVDQNTDHHTDTHDHAHTDPYRHRYAYRYRNANCHTYCHNYLDTDNHTHTNHHLDSLAHTLAHDDAQPDAHEDAYAHGHEHFHANQHPDPPPDGYQNADPDPDPFADALANANTATLMEKEPHAMDLIKVDFHVHSGFSPDSISDINKLYNQAKKVGLSKLVITDHDTIEGAVQLQKEFPDFVVVGEEIKTTGGEVLAYYLQEEIPGGLDPLEAFKRLRDQGAVISLSHPYAFNRHGWLEEEMIEYLEYLDAIETHNARCTPGMNRDAAKFARDHNLSCTAGSDSHSIGELGRMGHLLPDFNDAASLRQALKSAQPFGRESSMLVRLHSRYAFLSKKLKQLADSLE